MYKESEDSTYALVLNILDVCFICFSFVAGLWLFVTLLRCSPKAKSRTFWRQLFWLNFLGLSANIYLIYRLIDKRQWFSSMQMWEAQYDPIIMIIRVAASLVEVQIASGFCAAVFHMRRCSMALCWVFCLTLLPSLILSLFLDWTQYPFNYDFCVRITVPCVTSCFLLASVAYLGGVGGTRKSSHQVHKRALVAGFCYLLSFTLTSVLPALMFVVVKQCHLSFCAWSVWDELTELLWDLNGAANVITYFFCTWRLIGSGSSGGVLTFGGTTATQSPAASIEGSQISDAIIIDSHASYYDFNLEDNAPDAEIGRSLQ